MGMCGGNLDRDPGELGLREQEELELLKTTCWCCFAYCFGFGCNSPGGTDACCLIEGKLCCLWANVETDTCCDDGWIENTTKVCCVRRILPRGEDSRNRLLYSSALWCQRHGHGQAGCLAPNGGAIRSALLQIVWGSVRRTHQCVLEMRVHFNVRRTSVKI